MKWADSIDITFGTTSVAQPVWIDGQEFPWCVTSVEVLPIEVGQLPGVRLTLGAAAVNVNWSERGGKP